ncbi:hypothetical protein SAMN04490195_1797 [Pseudomonas moorei]|uniref:Uncharacterized protein n=1 Tax=Pseudomonas moorei TaxID=395599 RepID=A0A1H1DMU6_9PSED|nr:hypothetical protein SAMN04490195_1797 [Pseudomonas moorei]
MCLFPVLAVKLFLGLGLEAFQGRCDWMGCAVAALGGVTYGSTGCTDAPLRNMGVHIRFCGNGCWRFRPDGESLGKAPSNQGLLPLSFGASPRLGMPSLRSCSVGPPPSAIHGRGRLTRHPCRVAHCAKPALSLSRGQEDQKQKRGGLTSRPDCRVGMPGHSEAPNERGRALWLLSRSSKVTRRQGGTNSRYHRRNGFAHDPNPKTL